MNNEPVAWMDDCSFFTEQPDDMDGVIPLYTHPAKCSKCNDTEWVCENHPDQEAHKCIYCGGAGKPCECTHSAKTLTSEEIEAEWFKVFEPEAGLGKNLTNGIFEFARAILKKVSEK